MTALTALQFVVSGGLVTVAILSCRDWIKQRNDTGLRYQALAISSLAIVSVVGRVKTLVPSIPSQVLSPVALVAFFVSGYALWLLRSQIIPSRKAVRYALPAILLVAVLFSGVVTAVKGSPTPGTNLAGLELVATLVAVVAWVVCVLDPAIRFWLVARRRNSVQRARLRALSVGYLAIVAIFIFAILSFARLQGLSAQLALQVLTIPIVPLLWAAFSPPQWLKRLWRASEDVNYQSAIQEMVLYSPTREVLAERALDWSVRFVGGDAGIIVDTTSNILGTYGITREAAKGIIATVDRADGVAHVGSTQPAVVVPLRMGESSGYMVIVSGTLTPVFAGDEWRQLTAYAAVISIALERVAISERVAALEHAKSDFLNLASHELTGPLTVLQGYVSMLVAGDIDIKQKNNKITSILLRQIDQMALIVSQMIESARIDDGRLELHREACDLSRIARQVIQERIDLLPDTHKIELEGDIKLPVVADVERVRTIVLNLLDNAIKYSPDGGVIHCVLDGGNGSATFRISDEGIGIASKDREKLFIRFGRVVGAEHANIPGTGLGLYLCRELARRHSGDLVLLPPAEKGAAFLLELPLAEDAISEPDKSHGPAPISVSVVLPQESSSAAEPSFPGLKPTA